MTDIETLTQAALTRYRARQVSARDRVVILASTANYPPLVEAYRRAAVLAGADPLLIVYLDRPRFSGLPEAVGKAALEADVVADLNRTAWAYTDSHAQVSRALHGRNGRWVRAVGFEEDIENFLRTPPGDALVGARFRIVKRLIDGASRIRVSSSLGTDLAIVRGNPAGLASHPSADQDDTGAVGFAPPEDGVDGTIAFVGALRIEAPRLYKRHIPASIRMSVSRGRLTEIEPTNTDARFLRDWFDSFPDPTARQFVHADLGFDHRVTPRALDSYALRACFGGISIAFGLGCPPSRGSAQVSARNRVDMVLNGASCWIDNLHLMEEGRFTQDSGLLNPSGAIT